MSINPDKFAKSGNTAIAQDKDRIATYRRMAGDLYVAFGSANVQMKHIARTMNYEDCGKTIRRADQFDNDVSVPLINIQCGGNLVKDSNDTLQDTSVSAIKAKLAEIIQFLRDDRQYNDSKPLEELENAIKNADSLEGFWQWVDGQRSSAKLR